MFNNINSKKNKRSSFSLFRILILSLSFIVLGFTINLYINTSNLKFSKNSSSYLDDFYTHFNNCDFIQAETIFKNNYSSDISNNENLKNDLTTYFTGVINKVCSSLTSGAISDYEALTVLTEIKKYNVLNSSLDKLISSLDSKNTNISTSESKTVDNTINEEITPLAQGLKALNEKDYSNAISYFTKVNESNTSDYTEAQNYIAKCKDEYKAFLFSEADKLSKDDYYTKAIELLTAYDTNILGSKNKDISDKILSIETLRKNYLSNLNQ